MFELNSSSSLGEDSKTKRSSLIASEGQIHKPGWLLFGLALSYLARHKNMKIGSPTGVKVSHIHKLFRKIMIK